MGSTALNKLIGKRALAHHVPGEQWPIPDQFVGLEIELENPSRNEMRNHINNGAPYWEQHEDRSLRNGTEYVLEAPLMGSQLSRAITYFFNTFKDYTAGPRTSIHVHMNMRQDDDSMDGLKNILVLYYMYEEAFFRIADFNRKWCAYCNPFEDNPPQILVDVLRHDDDKPAKNFAMQLHQSAGRNTNRYYGLNINALQRFGTLEFRHFPLVHEEDKLVDWITLLMELKSAARNIAADGHLIHQMVTCPEDIFKLRGYFPKFWEVLSTYVDATTAYIRMVNVNGLALPSDQTQGIGVEGNPAWKRFLEEQTKRGKEVQDTSAKKPAVAGRKGPAAPRRRNPAPPPGALGGVNPEWIVVDDMDAVTTAAPTEQWQPGPPAAGFQADPDMFQRAVRQAQDHAARLVRQRQAEQAAPRAANPEDDMFRVWRDLTNNQ